MSDSLMQTLLALAIVLAAAAYLGRQGWRVVAKVRARKTGGGGGGGCDTGCGCGH